MADKNYEVKFKPNFENGVLIGMYKGLTAWASLVAQRASEKAPVDTGRLARSIHAGTPFPLSEFVMAVDVGTNVEYARAHEFGSGIHRTIGTPDYIIIRPKNAKALAFPWPNGPQDHPAFDPESGLFFFGMVKHPGVYPQPFLRPAMRETKREGRKLLWDAVKAELSV